MKFLTDASISAKKYNVSRKVEDLCTKLKNGIDKLTSKSIPVKGHQHKRKKSFFSKLNRNEKEIREQKDKLWIVLLRLNNKLPLDELRIILTGEQRYGIQLQELRSHFAGLRHEIQLVADLFPLYKIIKEEDEDRKGSEEDVEENRKADEMEKWERLEKWITELATKVDRILEKQKLLLDDEEVLKMELAGKIMEELEGDIKKDLKRINIDQDRTGGVLNDKLVLEMDQANVSKTELKESQQKLIGSEVKVVIKEIIVKIMANDINTELLLVSMEVARKKEEIQLSHRNKLEQLASEKASTVAWEIKQFLLMNYQLFTEFQKKYKNLGETTKLCFLCLAFFPEGVVIKKRLLIYWWIGEGLIDCTGKEKTMEDLADDVIDRLVDDGFLHIVDKMSGLEIDSYRMDPLVRFALVAQAKRVDFFDFEDGGMPTARVDSKSCKACLVDDSFIRQDRRSEYLLTYLADGEEEPKDDKKFQVDEKLRQLHAFFNYNRQLVDLNSNLFSKMKNLNVLHLGRWQNASRHPIEVETTDFLQGLKYMKHLKYISLQGVSQIRELPDLVCKLQFLRVLDLRACYNLQELPEDIGHVDLLTHLDISECYLLDGLPKSVSNLKKLQVMKGFVIGDPNNKHQCTLQDLKGFVYLRKLTICTSNEKFPGNKELEAFKNFVNLEKLSIVWGRGTLFAKSEDKDHAIAGPKQSRKEVPKDDHKALPPTKANKEGSTSGGVKEKQKVTNGVKKEGSSGGTVEEESEGSKETEPKNPFPVDFPKRLVKLDLQCFPRAECPKWLNPQNLTSLEKLYIRRGEMKTLGELQGRQWGKVQILLLKYLSGFMLTWDELLATFTGLVYLEKVNCPRLTFYPCNEHGEWKQE